MYKGVDLQIFRVLNSKLERDNMYISASKQ